MRDLSRYHFERLASRPEHQPLKVVIVGHVDHGKSSLIGRLLHDTGNLLEGKLDELKRVSAKRGMPLEWSFVLDSLQAERNQAVTIDTTWIWLRTEGRDVIIIDAPGHVEFLKNMISGAANADAAVLVVDAVEGMKEQTRRHAYLLKLLGIRQVTVVVNKIDIVEDPKLCFATVSKAAARYLNQLDLMAAAFIPVSARDGDNLVAPSSRTGWYAGPTLIESLLGFEPAKPLVDRPLRLFVQDVYKFDERRIIVGGIRSGVLHVGDRLLFSPGDRSAMVNKIESFACEPLLKAKAGETVGFTVDEPIFVERGHLASDMENPPPLSDVFRARIFWLAKRAMKQGDDFKLKLGCAEVPAVIRSIEKVVDLDHLALRSADLVERNTLAEVVIKTASLIALDAGQDPTFGRFVLVDGFDTVAGGVASLDGFPDQRSSRGSRANNIRWVNHLVVRATREERNGHRGAVIWLTGLPGAGKSTLAIAAERELFQRGFQVYALDGDNLRHGLNADLGFSPEERVENIRRVGEVSALFASAGMIVITAFISPYEADRARARAAAKGCLHEVYVKASAETCEKRDPKGLYKRARRGEITDFTGISAPYEVPVTPDLIIDTEARDVDSSVNELVAYIIKVCAV